MVCVGSVKGSARSRCVADFSVGVVLLSYRNYIQYRRIAISTGIDVNKHTSSI